MLEQARKQLKAEFFGLDDQIDWIIESIRFWYKSPEKITRPIVINLWGLTGTGKTALVKRLCQLLHTSPTCLTLNGEDDNWKLSYSTARKHQVLILDEFQYLRQKVDGASGYKKYSEVWDILNTGQRADAKQEQERKILTLLNPGEDTVLQKKKAALFKAFTGLTLEGDVELAFAGSQQVWASIVSRAKSAGFAGTTSTDLALFYFDRIPNDPDFSDFEDQHYKNAVIFVLGNLEDTFPKWDWVCPPALYRKRVLDVTSYEIKRELSDYFYPEQISRLGENHIVFPPMDAPHFKQLIGATLSKDAQDLTEQGYPVTFDTFYHRAVFDNYAHPEGGARMLLNVMGQLKNLVLGHLTEGKQNVVTYKGNVIEITTEGSVVAIPYIWPEDLRRANIHSSPNIHRIAVHEAGHFVAAEVLGLSPQYAGLRGPDCGLTVIRFEPESFEDFKNYVVFLLAGASAGLVLLDPLTQVTGFGNDAQRAVTKILVSLRDLGFEQFWRKLVVIGEHMDDPYYLDCPYDGDHSVNEPYRLNGRPFESEHTIVNLIYKYCLGLARDLILNHRDQVLDVAKQIENNRYYAPAESENN